MVIQHPSRFNNVNACLQLLVEIYDKQKCDYLCVQPTHRKHKVIRPYKWISTSVCKPPNKWISFGSDVTSTLINMVIGDGYSSTDADNGTRIKNWCNTTNSPSFMSHSMAKDGKMKTTDSLLNNNTNIINGA